MKYVGHQIDEIRERTNNLDYERDTSGVLQNGISQELILRFYNDALMLAQTSILNVAPNEFMAFEELSIVANTEAYVLTGEVFASNRISKVEYSYDGLPEHYQRLRPRTMLERDSSKSQCPEFYIRVGKTIYLNPIPSTSQGKIRVTYHTQTPKVDIRRGQVASGIGAGGVIAALTLTSATADDYALSRCEYVCLCDSDGVIVYPNVKTVGYSSSTHVLTLSIAYASAMVGLYVVSGKNTTTHCALDEFVWEGFLMLYTQMRTLHRDTSEYVVMEDSNLKLILGEALKAYADPSDDPEEIPIIDGFFA